MLISNCLKRIFLNEQPAWQGLALAKRGDGSLIGLATDEVKEHTLIIGPSRGRRDLHLTAAICAYDRAVIVVDPHQEQYARTAAARRQIGPVYRWPLADEYSNDEIDPTKFLNEIPSDWIEQRSTIYITFAYDELYDSALYHRKEYVRRSINRLLSVLTQQEIESGDLVCFVEEAHSIVVNRLGKFLDRMRQNNIWMVLYVDQLWSLGRAYGEWGGDQIVDQCKYRVWYADSNFAKPDQMPLSVIEMLMLSGDRVVVEAGEEVTVGLRLRWNHDVI